MINTPPIDWFGLSPILALTGASFFALLCAVLVPRTARRVAAAGCSVAGFTAGLVLAIWLYVDSANGHTIVAGAFYRDRWTALGQVILCCIGLATTLLAVEHVPGWGRNADPARRDDHVAEFFALLLASAAGMAFFVGAANLMVLFLSLEWFSIALYVMCAIDYDLEGRARGGPEVPRHRLVRRRDAPLWLGARVRRDGEDLLRWHRLGDRVAGAHGRRVRRASGSR